MMKKIISIIMVAVFAGMCLVSGTAFADENSKRKIESIIAGKQDYLVFASLGNKDTSYFDVQVMDIIGDDDALADSEKEDLKRRFEKSVSVSGIDSYMYFGDNDDKHRTGDNVLISMDYSSGDNYIVRNGVFRVDSINLDHFRFEVPETVDGTAEALELGALYTYVYTDGDIKNITIREDGVYYRNSDSENYTKQAENVGISLLDEFGDPTGDAATKYPELQDGSNKVNSGTNSKWELVLLILAAGLVLGAVFVKILKKFEKRYDSK